MNETVFQGSSLLRAKAIKPKLVIKIDHNNLSAGEVSQVTFTFSKVIRGFSMTDVTVKGGTLSNLSNSGDNKTYTATFTPTDKVNNLAGSLSVAAGSYTDIAGNKGTASNLVNISGDTLAPTVTLSSDKALLRINQTATLTLKFSETPKDFDINDLTVVGGKLSNLSTGSDGNTYTVDFTRTKGAASSVSLDSQTFTDTAGNANNASNSLSFIADTTAPTAPTINTVATDDLINATEKAATVTVTGTNETGATTTFAGNAVTQATATSWSYTLSAAAITSFGEGTQTVTALSTDAAGNSTTTTHDINVNTTAGNGSRATPATTQTSYDDVLNATTGSILDVSAIAYNAANGNDEYLLTLASGNLINSSANVEISGFSAGDKLVFDADVSTNLSTLNTIYSVADDLTNVSIYANNEGTVQIITLLGLTGSRVGVGGSIDNLNEFSTYFGSSVIDII